MRIGLVQMNTQPNKEENLDCAVMKIDALAKEKASLIVLPEFFNFLGPDPEIVANAESMETSSTLEVIRNKAIEHKVHIHMGSFAERDGDDIFNTGVVFNQRGEIIARYRKMHLFDVEIPGGRKYFESDIITAGDKVVTFTINDITFGMATCYDLRFPELFRRLSTMGVQVILLPAAFTLETGRDHWELLLRARAVENLCWVAAPNQWGPCPPQHKSFGRSMIVDPWGVVLAQASDGVTTLFADVDIKHLEEIRTRFPALKHIKKHIFQV